MKEENISSPPLREDLVPVSVCMASYNGASYIQEQILSVLQQIGPTDELIIVDDASSDQTVQVIQKMHDIRIRLIVHRTNQGVIASFEEALLAARGDVLFLCDNDDVWEKNKVLLFLAALESHPKANVAISRVRFINSEGLPTEDTLYHNRGKFRPGFWTNVWKNHYQGSAMAIRRRLLLQVLPFPRNVHFLHDCWIGTRNALIGGEVVYLDEPLLLYRRHGVNYSKRTSKLRQLQTRAQLLLEHLRRMLQAPSKI